MALSSPSFAVSPGLTDRVHPWLTLGLTDRVHPWLTVGLTDRVHPGISLGLTTRLSLLLTGSGARFPQHWKQMLQSRLLPHKGRMFR